MLRRISNVDYILVKEVAFSSIFQIGDSEIIHAFSRAMAIQREAQIFLGNEGNFPSYTVFNKPLPLPPINESVSFIRHNPNPVIKVKNINITGISSSSLLHIGSTHNVSMESRIKHIRQLLPHT